MTCLLSVSNCTVMWNQIVVSLMNLYSTHQPVFQNYQVLNAVWCINHLYPHKRKCQNAPSIWSICWKPAFLRTLRGNHGNSFNLLPKTVMKANNRGVWASSHQTPNSESCEWVQERGLLTLSYCVKDYQLWALTQLCHADFFRVSKQRRWMILWKLLEMFPLTMRYILLHSQNMTWQNMNTKGCHSLE